MSNLVIVAIPRAEDPVWKYSSEKVPHCTLLFLGENTDKANDIAAFLQHAVSILDRGPFGLTVDRRDKLGQDEADVLYFRHDWSTKELASFRSILLKDKNIRDAYDSTTQFPEWNPHLTMGYPSTPAKKDDRDYPGFHWVEFDRIALWTGNYEGPEFRLEYANQPWEEVSMSEKERGAEFIEHHGVKGMKWGVRKAQNVGRAVRGVDSQNRSRFNPSFQKEEGRRQSHDSWNLITAAIVPVVTPLVIPSAVRTVRRGTSAVTGGKAQRQDVKFERRANHHREMIQIHNKAVGDLNKGQAAINAKYKGVNLKDPKNAAKSRKYHQESVDMMAKVYQKHANATKSPSGKLQYDVELHGNDTIKIVTKKIKHADGDESEAIILKMVLGGNDQIVNWKLDELAQGENFVEDFLAHSGVKGMKWGVRRDRHQGDAHVTSRTNAGVTGRTRVKATQGAGQHAHEDAVKVAGKKAILKKSGTAALSNKDLRDIIERQRLETEAKGSVQSKGRKFVAKKLGQEGQQALSREIQEATKRHRPKP